MSIQLDTTRLSASAQTSAQDASPMQGTSKAVAALFGESSVSVTDGSATDLEALVARLKNESERTKFSLLLTSLSSIGQSLNETEKRTLEQCLSLFEKLDTLDGNAEKYSTELANEKAAALLLQTQIDALSKQIEQAVADGKAHNELVIEQKRVRAELEEKERTIADTKDKIDQTKNEISSVKGQISVVVRSIGEGTLKTIANDLAMLADPEKAERPAETRKAEEKEAEISLCAAIRDSLAKIERDIMATIEENRTTMV